MSFLQKLLHATEAVRAAERGDIQEAILNFIAAHAIDQEMNGAKEFVLPTEKLYQWLRTNGIELTESELEAALETLVNDGATFQEVE